MTTQQIQERVIYLVAETMNEEVEDIKLSHELQKDLGAESIDFLDIVFRLEKEFDIKIPRGELFPENVFQGDPEFIQKGMVTAKGIEELRIRMPFADLTPLEQDPDVFNVSRLFTVEMICRYIEGKLGVASQ